MPLPENVEEGRCTRCGRVVAATANPVGANPGGVARVAKLAAVVAVLGGVIARGVTYAIFRSESGALAEQGAKASVVAPIPTPAKSAKVDGGAPLPDDPSERCELRIYSAARGGGGKAVVALTEPGRMGTFKPAMFGSRGRLTREIVRQAVLMAARDMPGVTVRDASIGDPMPAGNPTATAELVVYLKHAAEGTMILSQGEGAGRVVLLRKPFRDADRLASYDLMAERAEAATRSDLPAVLSKLGLTGKPTLKRAGGPLPAGVDDVLGRMSFTAQFRALRTLHAAAREGGETTALLGALARGYANLGLLTDFQWDSACKAYQARAFLHAQRLIALDPKSPAGHWHRAYVATLAGAHWLGFDDLEAADKLVSAMPEASRPTPPAWVAVIDASCRYATDKLAAIKGPQGELAALLRLVSVEPLFYSNLTLKTARKMVEANPECFRAFDALCDVSGVGNLHTATTYAPQALSTTVPAKIAEMPGVPGAALKAIAGAPTRSQ